MTLALAGTGLWGIHHFGLPLNFALSATVFLYGLAGFAVLTIWTFGVQLGYALLKGRDHADRLTRSLAKEFAGSSIFQAVLGGITAALGEELFFRGFIQAQWGLAAGVLLFGLAHFGRKDIRVVSYWSFMHGLIIGLSYRFSGNILVPMMTHGFFDMGGVIYFTGIMKPAGSGVEA